MSPLSISVLFFLLLQLPIFNYGFNYRDEGYLLNNAQRINNGEIPYVNFSLAITPGAFYIQALALKLFGNYILSDRILYILCVILVLALSYRLFKFFKRLNYVFLLLLALVYAGMGFFASYNVYGVVFVLLTLFLFNKLRGNNRNYFYAFLVGFTNFLAFSTKQTYGVVFFFSLLFLISFFTERKYLFKNIVAYFMGSAALPLIFFLILYSNGILGQLVSNIFYFALSVKSDRLPFILTSLLFTPLFMFLVNFIKNISLRKLSIAFILLLFFFSLYIIIAPTRIAYLSSFYRQPTIYYFIIFFTVPLASIILLFKSNNSRKRQMVILSIQAFSLFLASAFSGRDYTTVIVTAPLYIPLFIKLLTAEYGKIKLPTSNMVTTILLVLFIFPSILSLFKDYGKLHGVGFKKENYENLSIKEAAYIRIPSSQGNDLETVITYVKSKTSQGDKLLCLPYCSFLNFLGGRKNLSYFSFFYRFSENDQDEIIKDIDINLKDNSIILIQRSGVIEKEANNEDGSLSLVKNFIYKKYKLVKATDNFYIYNK